MTEIDIETVEKAKELDNWSLFDVHRWSDYPEVNNAVDRIYNELANLPSFSGRPVIRKKHIKTVLLDLYVKYLTDPKMYSGYYRMKGHYTSLHTRYNKLHISYVTVAIVDGLEELGYVETIKGHYGRTGGSSHISRMRSTSKLIELIHVAEISPAMIEIAPDTECIILRNRDPESGKKFDIEYEDTPEIVTMRNMVRTYNNVLRANHIGIPNLPRQGIETSTNGIYFHVNKYDKFVRRIFNNGSFEDGGRFFGGWWQRIPKAWREEIRINNVPTIEIDYSGIHIVLLYAMKEIDYWEEVNTDPYILDGYGDDHVERMRDFLKIVMLASLNADNLLAAIRSIVEKINLDSKYRWVAENNINPGVLVTDFRNKHDAISEYFFSGYGIKLQNIDSEIAEHVLSVFADQDMPILCVHDSFIVPVFNEELLRDTMKEGFETTLINNGVNGRVVNKVKDKIIDEELRWGKKIGDRKSLYGYTDVKSGDEEFDKEASQYDPINNDIEEYYRDIDRSN